MGVFSREATLSFSLCLPSQLESTLKGKNFLLEEKFSPLIVDPDLEGLCPKGKQTVKVVPLSKNGKTWRCTHTL